MLLVFDRRMDEAPAAAIQGGLTEQEKRENVVRLVFGGSEGRFGEFCRAILDEVPPGTKVVLRGSAITGRRWKDDAPFDADGPGTSDLDVTLVGSKAVELFTFDGFFVPGVHSRPVSEKDPDIAPTLVPLRERLMAMVSRPVNIQASRKVVLELRGDIFDQPYLTLCEKPKHPDA